MRYLPNPISTAPRDGTVILVGDNETALAAMRWNPKGTNDFIQGNLEGIWEDPGEHFTWSEAHGYGPTHWDHVPEGEDWTKDVRI